MIKNKPELISSCIQGHLSILYIFRRNDDTLPYKIPIISISNAYCKKILNNETINYDIDIWETLMDLPVAVFTLSLSDHEISISLQIVVLKCKLRWYLAIKNERNLLARESYINIISIRYFITSIHETVYYITFS